MADGTLIKNFALTTELNDDDDFLVEDSVPTTKRTKYSTLKEAVTGDVQAQVGDAFSEETDYSFGDYCIYKNTLYQFTADHAAGAWLGTDVEATTISAELSELNGNMQFEVTNRFESNVSVPSETWTNGISVTLEAGTYIISTITQFPNTATGSIRRMRFGTTEESTSYGYGDSVVMAPVIYAMSERTFLKTLSQETTFYLAAYHDIGSTGSVNYGLYYIRLA
ncbi:MAG: hypothetical protein LUE63_00235 [Lachnospiraceae bacterium]|nr:hypothetical protein [Lachnospiraceae bacterium]